MKIIVDHAKCQGHAMCYNYAPDLFELDDDGYNRMPPFEVPADQRDLAERAVEACPERAITMIED
ncbi:MAG: ferredoxin [Sphingobium sp.]